MIDMRNTVIALLISIVAAYVTVKMTTSPVASYSAKETAYERIMRTKTIRCGWFVEPPFINFDANTNEKTGIVIDIVNTIAKDYDLKVEWETISNFAMMGEDLKQSKYDVICSSLINMPRGGLVDYADAFVFIPAYGYVRSNESRISNLTQLNDPTFIIAGQEGAAVTTVARQKFPKAQFHIIPSAELSEMFASILANKADVAFMIPSFYQEFDKKNPGTLKPLDPNTPLQIFTFGFGVKPEEYGLKAMINNSLHRMTVSGELAAIYAKHDPSGSLLYPKIAMSK